MKKICSFHISFLMFIGVLLSNFSYGQETGYHDKAVRSNEKECIKQVILGDDSLGKVRNHSCEKGSLSQAIKIYVSGMEQLQFTDCPAGFTKAFDTHKKAWAAMITVTDKYPDLRGEMHDLFDKLEKGKDAEAFKRYLKQIWDTWADIEKFIKP